MSDKPKTILERYKESPKGLIYVAPAGSGKTRVALKATAGETTTVLGTASLQDNFDKEEMKAFKTKSPQRDNMTYSKAARGHELPGGKNLILDESQYIRNTGSKTLASLKAQRGKYDKALLLSATPMYNQPSDIAPQVNLVANEKVIPTGTEFYKTYYNEKIKYPNLLARMVGVKGSAVRDLKSPSQVKETIGKYVQVADTAKFKDMMPQRSHETIEVPMSKEQERIYKYMGKNVPFSVKYKVKRNLPPSKTEAKSLNAYLSGMRQVSNTSAPFVKDKSTAKSTKLDRMVLDLQKELQGGGKALVYSNFIGAGIDPMRKRLTEKGIPHSYLVGSMPKSERSKQINQYTTKNDVNTFLYSGAGSEGLNLPKTTLVQLMEPHWNNARLLQAESRGIRRGDDPNRTVKVKQYVSTFQKGNKKTSGQFLKAMGERKDKEIEDMLKAIKYGNQPPKE